MQTAANSCIWTVASFLPLQCYRVNFLECHNCTRSHFQEAVLSTLLYPITSLLDGRGEGLGVAMATLERVGQIVAGLAASNSGRGILLR